VKESLSCCLDIASVFRNQSTSHISINECNNVMIIEAAVAEDSGIAFFTEGINNSMSYISQTGSLEVKKLDLDRLILNGDQNGEIPPRYIRIDVEGVELLVLTGAKGILNC